MLEIHVALRSSHFDFLLAFKLLGKMNMRVTVQLRVAVVLLVLLFLCLSVGANDQEKGSYASDQNAVVVYVDETGRDESCLPPNAVTPCTSLEAIVNGIPSMGNLTSLEIVIRCPYLELKEPVKFEGLSMVRIVGAPTQIQCISNSSAETNGSTGVTVVAVQDLSIEGVTFVNCGAFYSYVYRGIWNDKVETVTKAALHVLNCTNVMVRNITASMSNGAGMVVSNIQGGLVNISDSLFEHNMIPVEDREKYAGGGGLIIRIVRNVSSHYVVHSCTFVNNTPTTPGEYVFVSIFGNVLRGRGQGGGLLIRIYMDGTNNNLTVSNCRFLRNTAFFGGGLGIEMSGRSRNNFAVVRSSYFEENGCQPEQESGSAGGAHLGYSYYGENKEHARDNRIVVRDSVFTKNCGVLGGGTTFYSSRSDYPDSNNGISFINCSWFENSGLIGAAVDMSPHTDDRLSAGFLPTPEFTDCMFFNNSIRFRRKEPQQATAAGAVFSSLLNIKFIASAFFEQNSDSALVVINAEADFSSCSATFVNNTGVQGGAISLIGVSSMVLGPGQVYQFLRNKATYKGGAISSYLIDNHDFSGSRSCFIQYSNRSSPREWNISVIFDRNEAPIGRSIFTTAISSCRLSGISFNYDSEINITQVFAWHPSEVLRWQGVFYYDEPAENQIATDVAHLDFSGDIFEIIPGEQHSLQMNMTDDLNQLVDTTLHATTDEGDIVIDEAFSYIEDKRIQLRGKDGTNGTLLLQSISLRKTSFYVKTKLVPCPVGYLLNTENKCECDINSYEGLSKCDPNSLTAYIREGFWAGYREGSLVTEACPVEFCHYRGKDKNADIPLPRTSSDVELDDSICGPSRTGVLCGDCKEGYSVYYHSPYFSCQQNNLCIIGWLFFILSELVPATILFVVVLVFSIRFNSGKLNGFIFFSQLLSTLFISANDVIKVPEVLRVLSWGHEIFYGFFSLDFFAIEPLSFCLWEGATVLDVLAFKYVTIAYCLILVILFIVIVKYKQISAIGESAIHGLSAFLIVCYMQCVNVSLKILLSRSLQGRGGTLLSPPRVWFSGEIELFSPEHLPYAIPALLCLLTLGIIPPILLLMYPLNNKLAEFLGITTDSHPRLARMLSFIDPLKPIFDAFQSCFEDNRRFFAGLYFVYRWVGLLTYAVSPTLCIFYTVLEAILIIILMIHTIAQPYKKEKVHLPNGDLTTAGNAVPQCPEGRKEKLYHNTVDALLLTDLALINLCTGFNYYYTRVLSEEVRNQQIVDITSSFQLILTYLPILAMCVYLVVVGIRKFHTPSKEPIGELNEFVEREPPAPDANEDQSRESLVSAGSGARPTYGI